MPADRPSGRANLAPFTWRKGSYDVALDAGTTVPSDADTGYEESCVFLHTDATTAGVDNIYINLGTNTSANFDLAQFVRNTTNDATGVLVAGGSTVPADAASGYAANGLFIYTAGANSITRLYIGTAASCNFDAITSDIP